jgi:maltooligosyltrehalose trehalohydrolase
MHRFQVWAPLPKRVEVQVGQSRRSMHSEPGGWWTAEVEAAGPGSNYGFILDGQGPYPDPRSPSQPDGVHALSRLVNHAAFRWNDARFQAAPLSMGVLYELHVGSFTPAGTFDAAIEKLDHLVRLGITHVELMPVNAFPGAPWLGIRRRGSLCGPSAVRRLRWA